MDNASTQILQFLASREDTTLGSPTYREIAEELGANSVSTAQHHVRKLLDAGLIERLPGRSRGLQLTAQGRALASPSTHSTSHQEGSAQRAMLRGPPAGGGRGQRSFGLVGHTTEAGLAVSAVVRGHARGGPDPNAAGEGRADDATGVRGGGVGGRAGLIVTGKNNARHGAASFFASPNADDMLHCGPIVLLSTSDSRGGSLRASSVPSRARDPTESQEQPA